MTAAARTDADVFARRIRAVVGERGVIAGEADMAPYLVDERGYYRGRARLIVRPGSTAEVAAVVRACAEMQVPIVPQGGNTGLCGGATPFEAGDEIVMSLNRMNRVRAVDPLNYAITVEAGVILADVQKAAAEHDRLFPLSLGGEGTARIGGNLSTNAGGTGVVRYGNARDLVLGIEVVLPDGTVWDGLTALRKDNTGYDLKQLFIGAEGTLGIITAAVLKLFPRPAALETAFAGLANAEAAIELLSRARKRTDDKVAAFELIARVPLEMVLRRIPGARDPLSRPHPWYALIEISSGRADGALRADLEALLAEAVDDGLVTDAAIAESGEQRKDFWRLRETIPEAQKHEGASIKHDVSVPVSRTAEFMALASRDVDAIVPGARICAFGHVGDGNIHFNISEPLGGGDTARFRARADDVTRAIHDRVAAMAGSISAEHGIGRFKKDELVRYKPAAALDLMRKIKAAIDPAGIMNPGKVI
jgi:D-lactate dehydrogenase (cytochrome)